MLRIEAIRGQSEYDSLRVRFGATLAGARVPMQIDIGFGDAIQPPPIDAHYPVLLPSPGAANTSQPSATGRGCSAPQFI